MRTMKKVKKFDCVRENIPLIIDYIKQCSEMKERDRNTLMGMFALEDVLNVMLQRATAETIKVEVVRFAGKVSVKLSCAGRPFETNDVKGLYDIGDLDGPMADAVKNLTGKLFNDRLSIRHSLGLNICRITLKERTISNLALIISALFIGLLVGFAIKNLCPEDVSAFLGTRIFATGSTMFTNALKTIVAPLVFFSIAAGIAELDDIKNLGRIAAKVVFGYLFTSLVAIGVGFLIYNVFPIGNTSLASAVSGISQSTELAAQELHLSIIDTITGIIPSDIVTPFKEGKMLQIIFLAALFGIACAKLPEKFKIVRTFVSGINEAFSLITRIIIKFMPAAVFCSMAKLMISLDSGEFLGIFAFIPVYYIGIILMLVVYGLIMLIFGRLNPVCFYKKYSPAMVTGFSLASSNAAMPMSLKCCDKLGISRKISSFSIPLGATINMDGSCIFLVLCCLFMAKIFGIELNASEISTIIIAVMALSVGAPGVPGAALVCAAFLLPQIGVPADAVSLITGIYPLIGMALTVCNVTGDAALSAIVARSERMLDLKKFRSGQASGDRH